MCLQCMTIESLFCWFPKNSWGNLNERLLCLYFSVAHFALYINKQKINFYSVERANYNNFNDCMKMFQNLRKIFWLTNISRLLRRVFSVRCSNILRINYVISFTEASFFSAYIQYCRRGVMLLTGYLWPLDYIYQYFDMEDHWKKHHGHVGQRTETGDAGSSPHVSKYILFNDVPWQNIAIYN